MRGVLTHINAHTRTYAHRQIRAQLCSPFAALTCCLTALFVGKQAFCLGLLEEHSIKAQKACKNIFTKQMYVDYTENGSLK